MRAGAARNLLRMAAQSTKNRLRHSTRRRPILYERHAMPLHLIKLCVGCDTVQDLEDWIKQKLEEKKKRGQKPERSHTTRMAPKRTDELLDGGSIYWVIRGEVMCRERLIDIRPFRDKDGIGRCRLVLEPKLVLVQPRPYRAFQG